MKKCIQQIEKNYGVKENVICHIIDITSSFVETNYGKCIYCKNFKSFGLFSLCKIKNHLQPHCCYYDMDIYKFIKNQYINIHMQTYLQRDNKCTQEELRMKKQIRKKIMFQGAKIYILKKHYQEIGDMNV